MKIVKHELAELCRSKKGKVLAGKVLTSVLMHSFKWYCLPHPFLN